MTIKAIETVYNGYRFRSRLEARWAVYFDALNIQYQYEMQGFELGPLGRYLPDFYLTKYRIYVEVKPEMPSGIELAKILAFGKEHSIVIADAQPDLRWYHSNYCFEMYSDDGLQINQGYYPYCEQCCSFYEHKSGRIWLRLGSENLEYIGEQSDFQNAVLSARQARFEHGEYPRIYTGVS